MSEIPQQLLLPIGEAIGALRMKRPQRALEIAERLVDRLPTETLVLEIGGRAANELQDWPAAVCFWGKLAALAPERLGPRLQRTTALLNSAAWAAAVQSIEELLRNQPNALPLLGMKLTALLQTLEEGGLSAFLGELRNRQWRPEDSDFLMLIVQILLERQDRPRAAEWLELLALMVQSPDSLHQRMRAAFRDKNYRDLDFLCGRLVEIGNDRQKFEAHLFRARAAHDRGDPEGAAVFYEAARVLRPDHEESCTYLIRRALAAREFGRAELIVGESGESKALLPSRQWWCALIADAAGDRAKARDVLEEGIERFPRDSRYFCNAADFLSERSDLVGAEAMLQRALSLEPDSTRFLGRLLQYRLRSGGPPQRILDLCDRLLEIEPAHEEALLQKGNYLTLLSRRHEALAVYQTGTRLFPGNITFWRSAISTSLTLGDEDAAAAIIDRARQTFAAPTVENYVALAEVFEAADLAEDALAMARSALQADPERLAAKQIAARLYASFGYFDRAWPLLLELQQPAARHIRTVRIYAQVAAGRHALGEGRESAEDERHPDALFQRIAQARRPPRRSAIEGEVKRPTVLHVISTLGSGGAERQLAATVVGLSGQQNPALNVCLAVEDLNPVHGRDFFLPQVAESGIEVRCLDEERASGRWRDTLAAHIAHRPAYAAILSMPTEIVKLALPLLAVLIEKRPQVVHLWQDTVCIAGGIAAMLAGVPRIVLGTRSTRPVERQRARRYLYGGFQALLSRPEVKLLSNSRNGARDYEAWLGLAPGTVRIAYNGYDFESIRARVDDQATVKLRSELGIPAQAVVFGGVMRCSFEKRPELWTEVAIDLAGRRSDLHAILVGNGPMLPELQERVKQAGQAERIHFVGQRRPVEPWMRAMDVLFLSSMTEGLPNVLIEAQSLGVPVATMRVGGAPETVVENETAIVIDEGPIEAVADPIAALLGDPARRARLGEAGARWVESEFTMGVQLGRLIALYALADRCGEAGFACASA